MREIISFECTICKHRNYNSTKNKRLQTGRFEFKKFCKFCRMHTVHKEIK